MSVVLSSILKGAPALLDYGLFKKPSGSSGGSRESFKEASSLHHASDRYSPIARRCSDTTISLSDINTEFHYLQVRASHFNFVLMVLQRTLTVQYLPCLSALLVASVAAVLSSCWAREYACTRTQLLSCQIIVLWYAMTPSYLKSSIKSAALLRPEALLPTLLHRYSLTVEKHSSRAAAEQKQQRLRRNSPNSSLSSTSPPPPTLLRTPSHSPPSLLSSSLNTPPSGTCPSSSSVTPSPSVPSSTAVTVITSLVSCSPPSLIVQVPSATAGTTPTMYAGGSERTDAMMLHHAHHLHHHQPQFHQTRCLHPTLLSPTASRPSTPSSSSSPSPLSRPGSPYPPGGCVEGAADGLRQLQLQRASPELSPHPIVSPSSSPRPGASPPPPPPPPVLGSITEEPAKVLFQKNPQISVTDETGGQFLLTSSGSSPEDAMETNEQSLRQSLIAMTQQLSPHINLVASLSSPLPGSRSPSPGPSSVGLSKSSSLSSYPYPSPQLSPRHYAATGKVIKGFSLDDYPLPCDTDRPSITRGTSSAAKKQLQSQQPLLPLSSVQLQCLRRFEPQQQRVQEQPQKQDLQPVSLVVQLQAPEQRQQKQQQFESLKSSQMDNNNYVPPVSAHQPSSRPSSRNERNLIRQDAVVQEPGLVDSVTTQESNWASCNTARARHQVFISNTDLRHSFPPLVHSNIDTSALAGLEEPADILTDFDSCHGCHQITRTNKKREGSPPLAVHKTESGSLVMRLPPKWLGMEGSAVLAALTELVRANAPSLTNEGLSAKGLSVRAASGVRVDVEVLKDLQSARLTLKLKRLEGNELQYSRVCQQLINCMNAPMSPVTSELLTSCLRILKPEFHHLPVRSTCCPTQQQQPQPFQEIRTKNV
ncbi:Kinase associated domain 1 (KA1) [Trinorchestia longiramus]|nr:Kinase associated domain 1 (KA1) [Trinorchestia longiramus]